MKKNIFKTVHAVMAVAVIAAFTSCNKFLDIKPFGKTIPQTTEEYSALLNEMLAGIDGNNSSTTQTKTLFFNDELVCQFEEIADNLETNLTQYPLGSGLKFWFGNITNDGYYENYYATISRCNIILDNYEEGRDTRDGQDLVGTAYAIRGLCYYQLIRMYCEPVTNASEQLGMPIVTEFDMEAKPIRSSLEQTINQAESDFKEALKYDIQNEMCRFNNDVVKAMLARLYFWAGRYDEALAQAEDVLKRHPVLSGENYKKMSESTEGLVGNQLIRSDLIPKSETSTINKYLVARPMSIRFIKLFAEKDKDIRYRLFVGKKRTNKKAFFAGIRSAELYLIAMESQYHLGKTAEALEMLNNFRKQRIEGVEDYTMETLPAVDVTEYIKTDSKGNALTPLLQAILNERRKELYLEGDRFFELKRNGRPEFWVMKNGLKYTNKKYMYTLPIDPSDVQLNPAIQQNEGYTEVVYN